MFALPIFPGSRPPSIVGVHELNFCVRDGNRWTLMTINTNSYGWVYPSFICQMLSHLTAFGFYHTFVRLSILFLKDLVTHTGFEPMLTA